MAKEKKDEHAVLPDWPPHCWPGPRVDRPLHSPLYRQYQPWFELRVFAHSCARLDPEKLI